jgi:hypothetical protein
MTALMISSLQYPIRAVGVLELTVDVKTGFYNA